MPNHIQKTIDVYLSKLRKSSQNLHPSPNLISSSSNWILSGCKHPKSLSFAIESDRNGNGHGHGNGNGNGNGADGPKAHENEAATLSDIDRFLFENFNSLYREEINVESDKKCKKKNVVVEDHSPGFLFESPRLLEEPPEIRPSSRFFVSPSTSSSLVEEMQCSGSTYEEIGSSSTHPTEPRTSSLSESKDHTLPEDSVAVLTNSPDPYEDFRGSMEEMIEARLSQDLSVDWDYMEELLFCYLRLNEKKSYKYILGAFVDLVVDLRHKSEKVQVKAHKTTGSTGERRRRRRRKVQVNIT